MAGLGYATGELFSYVGSGGSVAAKHPLRDDPAHRSNDLSLMALDAEFEEDLRGNRPPSIAPERLLRALLLQALPTITRLRRS